jgi:hypothetical protein
VVLLGEIEIWFEDLKEYKQKELLEGLGIKTPKEANFDVFPISICHTLDEEDENES